MDKLCFGIAKGSETGFGGQATAFGGVGWVAAVQAHARMLGWAGWVVGRARPGGIHDQEEIRVIDYSIKRCSGVVRVVRSSLTMAAHRV